MRGLSVRSFGKCRLPPPVDAFFYQKSHPLRHQGCRPSGSPICIPDLYPRSVSPICTKDLKQSRATRQSPAAVAAALTAAAAFVRLKLTVSVLRPSVRSVEHRAVVAELADAHGSGPCTRKGVGVRVPPSAPKFSSASLQNIASMKAVFPRQSRFPSHKKRQVARSAPNHLPDRSRCLLFLFVQNVGELPQRRGEVPQNVVLVQRKEEPVHIPFDLVVVPCCLLGLRIVEHRR